MRDRQVGWAAAIWAFAEATFFFILPDFFLLPAVIARPRVVWRLVLSTFVGSVIGGLVLAALVTQWPTEIRELIEALPFTHPPMFAEVTGRIGEVSGVAGQPISGIPAKVWTWVQVTQGALPFVVFAAALWAARGVRFVAVALVALLIERVAGNTLRRHWRVALPLYAAVFLAALTALTGL